jgi:hypothetical protein
MPDGITGPTIRVAAMLAAYLCRPANDPIVQCAVEDILKELAWCMI